MKRPLENRLRILWCRNIHGDTNWLVIFWTYQYCPLIDYGLAFLTLSIYFTKITKQVIQLILIIFVRTDVYIPSVFVWEETEQSGFNSPARLGDHMDVLHTMLGYCYLTPGWVSLASTPIALAPMLSYPTELHVYDNNNNNNKYPAQ